MLKKNEAAPGDGAAPDDAEPIENYNDFDEKNQAEPIALSPIASIQKNLTPEHTGLIRERFGGRENVFATHWSNKAGKSGYSWKCANRFVKGKCDLKAGCGNCPHEQPVPMSDEVIKKHVFGGRQGHIVGIYPLLEDNTCKSLAFDLDKHKESDPDPFPEAMRLIETGEVNDIPIHLEPSKSGDGYHDWIFFSEPVPAWKARLVGFALLKEADCIDDDEDPSTFDRMFPNQDELSGKKLGNLIALPFQGGAGLRNNTLFRDPATDYQEPYADQWNFLENVQTVSEADLDRLISEWDLKRETPPGVKKSRQAWHGHQSPNRQYKDVDFDTVCEECAFMRNWRDEAVNLSEPFWYAGLSIAARCINGRELSHKYSSSYPGYSEAETDQKIDHALKDTGPYLCETIKTDLGCDYCDNCPHRDEVITPLHLGEVDDNWTFEDAATHIVETPKYADISNLRTASLVEDILTNNSFSEIELDLIKGAIKKHLKVTKKAQDKMIVGKMKEAALEMLDEGTLPDDASHIQMVDFLFEKMIREYPHIVGCEGALWLYGNSTNGLFKKYDLAQLEIDIAREFIGYKNAQKRGDYRGMAQLQYNAVLSENHFKDAPYGLPGRTTFYIVSDTEIVPTSYCPELRQRWRLDGDPDLEYDPMEAPIFQKYLDFALCDKQQLLLQECIGALLTGCMKNLQKAVLLLGPGSNGKSVILDILSNLINPDLRCSVNPEKMDDDYFKALLPGKIVNIVGEVEKSKPIKAGFKDIVACDTPLTARVVYREPFMFLPQCGHIFSCNDHPMTRDHSHGFYRRWVIIAFPNVVPDHMKIPRLGEKIVKEEMTQVMAWALEGAQRLIKNKFQLTETSQHVEELKKWQNAKDSVFSFLSDDEAVVIAEDSGVEKQCLYKVYKHWCGENAGVKHVGRNEFYKRVQIRFPNEKRSKSGRRCFVGLGLTEWISGGMLLKHREILNGKEFEYFSSE